MSARIRIGGRGQGSLLKCAGSPNWFFAYHQHGIEHRVTTGTEDLKAAKRFAKQRLDEISMDRQGVKTLATPTASRLTVKDLIETYEADVKVRGLKSAKALKYHIAPVVEHFGDYRVREISAKTVDRYIAQQREAGKSNATINRRTQVLSAAFKLALQRRTVTEVPHITKLSEAGNAKQGFFEREQFDAIVAALPDYLRGAVQFGYLCGWRKSSVAGLRWADVDLKAGTITLPTTKNGKRQSLAIGGDVAAILKRAEQARLFERDGEPVISDLVFHRRGKPLGDFRKAWATAAQAAGLAHREKGKPRPVNDLTFHDLRRTASRNLVLSGIREGAAMAVTGHKTRAIFDRYAIVSPDETRKAMVAVSSRQKVNA